MNIRKNSITLTSAALALLTAFAAQAATPEPYAYQTLPGVSPAPITEGAGLKSAEELEAFLDGIMAAQLKSQHAAGAVVSVVKDGKLFFSKGYGYADVEKQIPVDGDKTLFRNGSVSKMFTWTALMQLVEQGKVSLDADVNTYVTQFKVPDTFPGNPITVRNLLTHTVGLEDGALGYLIVDKAEYLDIPAEALSKHMPLRIRAATTDFATGDNSAYSNWGASLAGLIVANVSGLPFEEYVEKNIFAPLSMTQATFRQPVPADLAANVSLGYKFEGGRFKAQDFEYVNFAPAGSMSVTATDMARFMIAHLGEGGGILKPETAQLMHSRVMSPNPYVNGSGLGFYENHINGRRIIAHAGDTQFFHSDMTLLPNENVGIFYSVNSAPTLGFSTRGDLLEAFMDRYYPAKLPIITPPADFKERAARYAGNYRLNRHSHSTNEKLFSLASALKIAPSARNTLLASLGPMVWEFVEVAPAVFRRTDSDHTIAFVQNADGEVSYVLTPISMAFMGAYKIPAYESPAFLALVLGFALLCFVIAIVSALRHWKADRLVAPNARRARRLAALVAAVNLLFLIGLVIVAISLTSAPLAGYPPSFKVFLVLPILAIPLSLALVVFAALAWKNTWWSRYTRVQYTLIALASVAFLWLLCLANLIGWNFG